MTRLLARSGLLPSLTAGLVEDLEQLADSLRADLAGAELVEDVEEDPADQVGEVRRPGRGDQHGSEAERRGSVVGDRASPTAPSAAHPPPPGRRSPVATSGTSARGARSPGRGR